MPEGPPEAPPPRRNLRSFFSAEASPLDMRILGRTLLHAALVLIEAEFDSKRKNRDLSQVSRAARRVDKMDDNQLQAVARFWMSSILRLSPRVSTSGSGSGPI